MNLLLGPIKKNPAFCFTIAFLLFTGFLILRSIAPFVFPGYFIYLFSAVLIFFIFSNFDFDILELFSWQFYVFCIVFLIIPLIIGQVTRGAVRWIPIGSITLQPSELIRPFVLVFFAHYLTVKEPTFKRFLSSVVLLGLVLVLILLQPSLGVTVLTAVGFFGVLLASSFSKRSLFLLILGGLLTLPLLWFLLAPYQRSRVVTFISPQADPTGAGYNSLQSMISVGSGKLWGRGLGEGVQTQLSFLPERHTDFVFASVAEEMGFLGAIVLLLSSFFFLVFIVFSLNRAKSHASRAFITGFVLTLFVQTVIHVGMNMGLLPITGVPLPLVSSGGSSLLATMTGLGIVLSTYKKEG